MNQALNPIEKWFSQRPLWLQDAARRIIQNGDITPDDLEELITLCKQEAGAPGVALLKIKAQCIPPGSLQVAESPTTLRLEEISNVQGINTLSPRKPLNFGNIPLTIIYGGTGSGKSGYVRILKHACGAKMPGELHGDVFRRTNLEKSCTFKVKIGENQPREIQWSPSNGILGDIRTIEIYDTDCAHVYLTEENEVAYEPWVLSLFTQLTDVCTRIGKTLKDEIDQSSSKFPLLPPQHQGTKSSSWYSSISHQTKQQEINARCLWNAKLQNYLTDVNNRLSELDPAEQARQTRQTKTNLIALHSELEKSRNQLSDYKCSEYLKAKKDAAAKRKAADEDAKKVFKNAPLGGVGSESWILLWEQARDYSETTAYMGIDFPNISDEARCVLCQQILDAESRQRFTSFEDFVKGKLQDLANEAEEIINNLEEEIDSIPSSKDILLRIASASITANKERDKILKYHASIIKRKYSLFKSEKLSAVTALPSEALLKELKTRSKKLEKNAEKYDKDAEKENRDKLKKHSNELTARKWLSDQRSSIEQEIIRLKHIYKLNKARKLTNTRPLSDLKSSLTEALISPDFIKRFKTELQTLGADRINVKLIKTRTRYGHVYHKIQLDGCTKDICPTTVLSEGEFRIVSLATFLADVEGQAHITPFIFDDPISSLDQDFEEATAKRLVDLCHSRQVIVFTHRLSLLSLLEDACKKAGIEPNIKCLRNESWGAGEPGDTPIFAKKPINALNHIRDHRLGQARKVLKKVGKDEYEHIAKSICSDIRILIERLIENDLLSDVVQRFRREVQTKNKIHKLSKINADDCKLLDDYMTEYSKYEHSQPSETPVQMPEPDKIKTDIDNILTWLDEFKKR
ncbi:AAA family ATPase [Thermodesulfobacteriota bacterium]